MPPELGRHIELIGVVDIAPTPSSTRPASRSRVRSMTMLGEVDIVLDATPCGVGRKNKELDQARGVKAVFQGGAKNGTLP